MAQNRFYSSTAVATAVTAPVLSGDTTITVGATTGFPTSYPFTVVIDGGTAAQEILSVTSVSSLTLSVSRGQDGSTALAHANGATVTHDVSARDYNEPQLHIAASSAVHGIAGSVVGTTDAQSLTNKTLPSPTISGTVAGSPTITSPIINSGVLNSPTLKAGGTNTQTLPTSADTLVGRATTDTLTNKTLTSPAINGGVLDATSAIDGVTGTQIAADHATVASLATKQSALAAPLAGSSSAGITNANTTIFTIGSLAIGTWIITVSVSVGTFGASAGSGTVVTTPAGGITLTGKTTSVFDVGGITSGTGSTDLVLTFKAVVGTAGNVVIATGSSWTTAEVNANGAISGYTATQVG